MVGNSINKKIQKIYITYLDKFPIERGKYRLGVILNTIFGRATYEVNGILLLLSPISLIERKLIIHKEHDHEVLQTIKDSLTNGGHFIDIGAHIGYFTLFIRCKIT